MNDEQTRKVLAEIDDKCVCLWDYLIEENDTTTWAYCSLRLLAKCWHALGKIIQKGEGCSCSDVQEMVAIARKARSK